MTKVHSFSTKDDKESQEVEAYLDKWEQKGHGHKAKKIREAVAKLGKEEELGQKKLPAFGPQKELKNFPAVFESWTPEMLAKFDPDDLQRVYIALFKRKDELGAFLDMLVKQK